MYEYAYNKMASITCMNEIEQELSKEYIVYYLSNNGRCKIIEVLITPNKFLNIMNTLHVGFYCETQLLTRYGNSEIIYHSSLDNLLKMIYELKTQELKY